MHTKTFETEIIVAETFNQIDCESKKSVWERNTELLNKLHSYLIEQINELASYGVEARFGPDTPDAVRVEIEARNRERLRKIKNRKRATNREETATRAARIVAKFKEKAGEY